MNENVILSTYAVPLLVSGKVLFKNLKILQSHGRGLFFKVQYRSDNKAEVCLGELLAYDFPRRSCIPLMLKPA